MTKKITLQLCRLGLFGSFLLPSYGALVTYTDRALLSGAAPNLPTERFAAALVAPGKVVSCYGPLSNMSNNACFPAHGLLPGVAYSSTSGTMAVIGTGYSRLGNSSQALGPNLFSDSLYLTFAQTDAVGFDVLAGPNPGNVLISIFNPANILLGSYQVAAPFGGTFFGVVSDTDLIGTMTVDSQANPSGEAIENLSFGLSPAPEPCSLLLLSVGLIGFVLWHKRRRARQS